MTAFSFDDPAFMGSVALPSTLVTSGLVASFDAANALSYPGSGSTWTDISGSGNTATLVGSPTFSTANGGAIVFNGTSQSGTITYGSSIPSGGAARTLAALFVVTSSVSAREILGIGANAGAGSRFALWLSSTSQIGVEWGAGGALASFNALNQLVYLVATLPTSSTTSTRIFVNGAEYTWTLSGGSHTTINSPSAAGGGEARIGAIPKLADATASQYYFSGRMSAVQIYNRALDPTEVLQNWNFFSQRL